MFPPHVKLRTHLFRHIPEYALAEIADAFAGFSPMQMEQALLLLSTTLAGFPSLQMRRS